jgi:hypothetical protein
MSTGRRRLVWSIALLVVVGVILIALPYGLRWGALAWYARQPGLEAQLDDVGFNPFSGRLSIEGLRVQHEGEPVLVVEQAMVQLDWWPLWKQHVQLQQIEVNGATLLIESLPDRPLVVAGLRLEPSDTLAEQAAPPGSVPAWEVATHRLHLEEVAVIVRHRYQETTVAIDQLQTSAVSSSQPELNTCLEAQVHLAGGTLQINGEVQPFGSESEVTVALDHLDLATLEPVWQALGWSEVSGTLAGRLDVVATTAADPSLALTGTLEADHLAASHARLWLKQLTAHWQGDVQLSLRSEGIESVAEGQLELSSVDVDLLAPGFGLTAESVRWAGQWRSDGVVQGEGAWQQFALTDLAQKNLLLAVARGEIGALQLAQQHVTAEQLLLEGVRLLGRDSLTALRPPQVATLGRLLVTRLDAGENLLRAETVTLSDLQANLVRLANGSFEARQWLPTAHTPTQPAPHDGVEPAWGVVLDQLRIDGASRIALRDEQVTPTVEVVAAPLAMTVRHVDSRAAQQRSTVTLQTRLDDYAELDLSGDIALFAMPLSLSAVADVREFQLPELSPYVEHAIGYRLAQGQLNLHINAPVEQGRAEMVSQLELKRLQLQPLDAAAAERTGQRLGLPVPLALSLLRDRQGDIALTVPIRGDLASLDVGLGDVVRKAIVGAVKNSVAVTLAPLGIVVKAGQLVGIGGALTFEPLEYVAGGLEMTEQSRDYLGRIHQLLSTRPKLTVSVCGRVTDADARARLGLAADKEISRTELAEQLTAERIQLLARQRAEDIKRQLVAPGQVQPRQILLCNPPQLLEDGLPSVLVRL